MEAPPAPKKRSHHKMVTVAEPAVVAPGSPQALESRAEATETEGPPAPKKRSHHKKKTDNSAPAPGPARQPTPEAPAVVPVPVQVEEGVAALVEEVYVAGILHGARTMINANLHQIRVSNTVFDLPVVQPEPPCLDQKEFRGLLERYMERVTIEAIGNSMDIRRSLVVSAFARMGRDNADPQGDSVRAEAVVAAQISAYGRLGRQIIFENQVLLEMQRREQGEEQAQAWARARGQHQIPAQHQLQLPAQHQIPAQTGEGGASTVAGTEQGVDNYIL